MTWKVLIIGLGNIGLKYDLDKPDNIVQTHARAFNNDSNFHLIGGVDPDKENRNIFNKTYSTQTFENVIEACEILQPNVVVIASPTNKHLDNLTEVLSYSKPDVVVMEKPASYTKSQANQMIKLSLESSVPILVNLIRRTDPSVQEIKLLIEKGTIKTPCKGVVWYSKGLVHNACHFIDLLSWWLGAPTKIEVLDTGRQINEWDIEVDLRICFGDSSVYFLVKKSEEFNYYNIELLAQNGRLTMGTGNVPVCWQAKSKNNTGLGSTINEIKNELYQYQLNATKDIALFLNNKKNLMPTLAEHVDTLDSIYELTETWEK